MKRIKQIIESLRVISDSPAKTITHMVDRVLSDAEVTDTEGEAQASAEDMKLVKNLLLAIIDIAKDMEKSAKAEAGSEGRS